MKHTYTQAQKVRQLYNRATDKYKLFPEKTLQVEGLFTGLPPFNMQSVLVFLVRGEHMRNVPHVCNSYQCCPVLRTSEIIEIQESLN